MQTDMESERSGKTTTRGRASVRTSAGSGTRVRGRLLAGFKIPAMAVAGIVMLVLSCGDGAVEPTAPPAPVAATVTVNPGSAALSALGETARFTAEVRDQNGQVMAGTAIAWASSNASVATVDASGVVTAAANGSASITATAGSASGTAAVTVTQVVTAVAVSPAADTLVAFRDTVRLVAEAVDANGHGVAGSEFEWSSSDTLVARVDDTGLVTGVDEGMATITATTGDYFGIAEITTVENPEWAALVALYEATDGPNWVDNTNWLTDAPLGEWYGVETDVSGRVVGLNLSGQLDEETLAKIPHGLTGPIPPELGNLRNLQRLNLSWNNLNGPIPPELGQLDSLRNLLLMENRLSGHIPPELGSLAELQQLFLGGNLLTRTIPPELGDLAKLRHLFLARNRLTGPIPSELGNLVDLDELSLARNRLTGPIPPELGNLVDLEYLSLIGNGLSGRIPPELGNLVNLDELNLAGNRLSGPLPAELGNLVNLRSLWLNANDLSGPIPSELGDLRQLRFMWLHYNRFTGPFPQSFLDLPISNLGWNCGAHGLCVPGTSDFVGWLEGVSKDGPFCNASDQATLSNLFQSTGGNGWSESAGWLGGPALEEWHGVQTDSLGRVTALHLSDNGLSGGLPADIADLAQLTELRIDGNALGGRLPLSLTQLDLQEFHYDGTKLCTPADERFQAWLSGIEAYSGTGTECPPLTDRDVLVGLYEATGGPNWTEDGNWLSDNPLEDWHGVETDEEGRVVGLSLRWNNMIGVIPPELGGLAQLEYLNLSVNDLSGPIPPELGRLARLEHLSLGNNGLSGPIPPELGRLAKLGFLDLGGGNRLSGTIPPELGGLSNLWWVRLSSNTLTGPIPGSLGLLTNLRDLDLGNNALSGPVPLELGNLSKLVSLKLGRNVLSGPIPAELGGLHHLRTLELARNPALAGAVPATLRDLRLQSIQAGGTGLCVPREVAFEAWLETVPERWIAWCGDRPTAYLTQAVQSHAHPVPLVAGDDALLRVFLTSARETTVGVPPVRARFYLDGIERHTVNIAATATPIPTKVDEGDLGKSANARIPGRIVRPGLEMVVEIDPDGTLEAGLGVPKRIPETGRIALDVRETPVLDLTLIPFLLSERPDSAALRTANEMAADPVGHEGLRETRDLLPVGNIEVTAHPPVVTDHMGSHIVFPQVEAIRALEGGKGHYMGLASGRVTPVPTARVGGRISVSNLRPETIAHELGHNMSLLHAPCGAAGGPDPLFPEQDGSIGAWGYDFERERLVEPGTPDLMTYCNLPWVNGYHFAKALAYRQSEESASAFSAATTPAARSLLLWGGIDREGNPFLNSAFVVDAPPALPTSPGGHTVTGRDAEGAELFSLSFAMPEALIEEEGEAVMMRTFAFVLPVRPAWADALARITLSEPDASVTLDRESDLPMVILRDPRTGQVRGFLRDLPPSATQAAADAVGQAAGQGLETLFSRGIPDRAAWRR